MITGRVKQPKVIKNDVEYRKLQALNYSMLKVWDENPTLFFEQFKLGRSRKNKKSMSTTIGDLTHFYLLDCNGSEKEFDGNLDKKFTQINFETGTAQVYLLVDYIVEEIENSMTEEGVVTKSLADCFQAAYDQIKKEGKYKGKDEEKVWDDFEKNGQEYFTIKREALGKTIVTPIMIEKGKFIGKRLMSDEFTHNIFINGYGHNSYPIQWLYENEEKNLIDCKSEIDRFIIDEKNKKIYLYDLKCTWDNEGFEYGYLKYGYYIQQAFYYLAMVYHFSEVQPEFADYEIVPMQYIVADTSLNNRRPLIYKCTEKDLNAGLYGFKINTRRYKGIHELIEEISWAENTNIWDISKEAYEKNGIFFLNFDYNTN